MKKVGITPGPVKFENMEPNDVKQFTPSNAGTEGQILTKTSNGYNWATPSGGSDVGCLASTGIHPGTNIVGTHADILANSPETFNAVISFDVTVHTKDNKTQYIDSLKASVVFNKVPGSSLGYIANTTLHVSGIYSLSSYVSPMLINILMAVNPVEGDTTKISTKYSGVAVFNKTFKDIEYFMLSLKLFDICVNQ